MKIPFIIFTGLAHNSLFLQKIFRWTSDKRFPSSMTNTYIYTFMSSLTCPTFIRFHKNLFFLKLCALFPWQLLQKAQLCSELNRQTLSFLLSDCSDKCRAQTTVVFSSLSLCGTTTLRCPPPHVATLGERGRADDFGGHPGVGPGGAHFGGAVPLPGQAKVSDLQGLVAQVFHLNPLQD